MDILAKSAIFDSTPTEKWFGQRIFTPWNFLKNPISISWDSFQGGESRSYVFFLSVTDGQNANPYTDHTPLQAMVVASMRGVQWSIERTEGQIMRSLMR